MTEICSESLFQMALIAVGTTHRLPGGPVSDVFRVL
jgi:hypothetical protein